jgi:hypothetical protein
VLALDKFEPEAVPQSLNAIETKTEAGSSRNAANFVREKLPPGGLFADQDWRTSPSPFPIGEALSKEIESLGRVLLQFYRALNLLYRNSLAGKEPAWVASWLDQGKPEFLRELQRSPAFKNELPRVIRPDILLTEEGIRISELDSVPGGIGLTAWLNLTYSQLRKEIGSGPEPIGGDAGMIEGFRSIFGAAKKVSIVISEEAAAYRPEMEWLCAVLNQEKERFFLREPSFTNFESGEAVYRFFELFDLANVPGQEVIFAKAAAKELSVTPPPKTIFEEKLLFALLWNRNLQSFWKKNLGEAFFHRLLKAVPYTWLVDPEPLPPHASIPRLEITQWEQLKSMSQRERDLILKVSGYSEKAWGARGVYLGSDLSLPEWAAAVDLALNDFSRSPFVLQQYHKPRIVDFSWFDFTANEAKVMPGRVRLCPYYFVSGENDASQAKLGGILATVCPADKKIIHGMKDAILAPCSV